MLSHLFTLIGVADQLHWMRHVVVASRSFDAAVAVGAVVVSVLASRLEE